MRKRSEDGYALLVVLLVLSVFVISLAKALPGWKTEIQREREARTIDHGREYRTAIKRYFHKNGRYPASLDVLFQKDGNGIRYLRQKWPDTLSAVAGGSDSDSSSSDSMGSGSENTGGWQLLHYGQAVTAEIVDQIPKAALAANSGSAIAGPGLSSGISGSTSGTAPGTMSGGGAFGGAMPGGAALGGAMPGGGGAIPTQGLGQGGVGQGIAGQGIAGSGGAPGGAPGTGAGLTPITSGPGATTSGGGGGGPIIGVASMSKKPAVHSFNGFDIPNDWQFVYNYAQDPSLTVGATPSGGGLAPTQPGGTSPAPSGPGGVGSGGVGSGGIGSGAAGSGPGGPE